jgi:H+-translocating NAD(P) transhydrogenase subunit alpha
VAVTIAVVRETAAGESRVALVPADVPTLIKHGARVRIESGAGLPAGYPDEKYREKGAEIVADRAEVLSSADLLAVVRGGAANPEGGARDAATLSRGAAIVGLLDPWRPDPAFDTMVERHQRAFALERLPRITRAQSMDVLSSQANLAGYRAVLLAATHLPRIFPMLMTAAGTVVPARVLVVGVGVAGLQAIATAKRLGAVVSAYDVRPAVKEQVESLGARFVELDLDAEDSETTGGYAKQMDEEFYRRQRELMTAVVAEQDVVITTALIPGKAAPTLVTAAMVRAMAPGTVIVDLAAERGGNCELTRPGETVWEGEVQIVGPLNIASGVAHHASQLYSRNIVTFLATILTEGELTVDRDDEIIAATLVVDGDAGSSIPEKE